MSGVNKAILIGNLGRDPELRYLPNGSTVVNLAIATSEKWKDKNTGQQQERTEWHRVSFFGKPAEIIAQYCTKGSKLYVEGSLYTNKYQKDGVDHYSTEIRGRDFQFLSSNQQQDGNQGGGFGAPAQTYDQSPQQSQTRVGGQPQAANTDDDLDIPF